MFNLHPTPPKTEADTVANAVDLMDEVEIRVEVGTKAETRAGVETTVEMAIITNESTISPVIFLI
jgi:hypothetical protein